MCVIEQTSSIKSRGSLAKKSENLGGLHVARLQHLSQFFTPKWVVEFIWKTISQGFSDNEQYSLLDNSVGAASMFRFANPAQHHLFGLDVDGELIGKIATIFDQSGYTQQFVHSSMEFVKLGRFSVGLINPPFSITLNSPYLTAYEGVTHYGKFGSNSSALSHEYALMQALTHCACVAAIVPRTTTSKLKNFDPKFIGRLRAVYQLPSDTFKSENVSHVNCDLLIFVQGQVDTNEIVTKKIFPDSIADDLGYICFPMSRILAANKKSFISVRDLSAHQAVITLPATHDKRVVLNRAKRNIVLKFFDGATQAKVLNAIYSKRLHSNSLHRYAASTQYAGQYKLSLDVLVMQDDPWGALESVVESIRSVGGVPVVSRDLRGALTAAIKHQHRMMLPFSRVAYQACPVSFTATAKKLAFLKFGQQDSIVSKGDLVTVVRQGEAFLANTSRGVFTIDEHKLSDIFDLDLDKNGGEWTQIHPPIRQAFPAEFSCLDNKARELGLDKWLTWEFQFEDLLELAFKGSGFCAFQMALGKTRVALALSMLLGGRSLVVVKSRLLDEFQRELIKLNVDSSVFQVITDASHLDQLRKVNFISYELLKREVLVRGKRTSFARLLKGGVVNVIADEGGLLCNSDSLQSKALWELGAKRRYCFDGTPMNNGYPREILGAIAWVAGQGRSYQPYSLNNAERYNGKSGFVHAGLFNSAEFQPMGNQEFIDQFVVYEWATNEWLDSGKGARREVPKIKPKNLGLYRDWLSRFVKRRVQQEPAVSRYVRFPVPVVHPAVRLDWDAAHLALYVDTVDTFAHWYRTYKENCTEKNIGINLTIVLQRLEACFKAANAPSQFDGEFVAPYFPLTSKERYCLDLVETLISDGHRPIVFARSPAILRRLANEFDQRGVTNFVFTGEEGISKRIAGLNKHVREGMAAVMLASLGVTQDGLNLPEFDRFVFFNRSYKAREEVQAMYRLLRPTQQRDVEGFFLHLDGSIDDYMGQLMEWKSMVGSAGVDYCEQDGSLEFSHFDAFIERMLDNQVHLRAMLGRRSAVRRAA